jgi:hypothetical protein
MSSLRIIRLVAACLSFTASVVFAADVVPTDIQQPGTQPGEISGLESPNKCDNCHGGYNKAVEPAHNWRGSMMAHAGRDPIFWATLAIAEQDFNGSGDLCLRCHSTTGWLGGRSTPTDGSGLAASDSDGVDCDFCHKVTNPDFSEHMGVMNAPFIANDGTEGYHGSGMASMWGGGEKLGPYADAEPKHQFLSSKFHRSADFCGTCHDVSNPAVGDLAHNQGAQPTGEPVVASGELGGLVESKAAFNNPPYKYGVVERTYSEFMSGQISQTKVSDYQTLPSELQGGALQAIYEAATAGGTGGNYQDGTTRYYTCQSCHVRPVTGTGANKRGIPERTDMPLHDMTGGNYWMPAVIDYLNARGKLRLGGDMAQTEIDAMHDGALRAKEQLRLAASLRVAGNTLKVINHTGHKLISGYPEGRRMWLNIKWYDSAGTELPNELGAYGDMTVSNPLGGANITVKSLLNLDNEREVIYEAHYGMTSAWAEQLIGHGYSPDLALSYNRVTGEIEHTLGELAGIDGEEETFHFVLNNAVLKDNRIPPYGMSYDKARVRNALPVPAAQFGGGTPGSFYRYWDEIDLANLAPTGATSATINLMYQPTSWEYIQFLTLANKGSDPGVGGNAFLGDEGKNLFEAWLNTGMAEPYLMASTTWGAPPSPCKAPTPTLLSATAGNKQVTLAWETLPDTAEYDHFNLYYDQAGKAQTVEEAVTGYAYTDTELTNGQDYCYKLTSVAQCESDFSNIVCATPAASGQAVASVAEPLKTGRWVKEGKGKNATVTFEYTTVFNAGDSVVIQGIVSGHDTTLSGATVEIIVSSGGSTVASLTSDASDSTGNFEATWQTSSPNKQGTGGTPAGSYRASVSGISLSGYSWDGNATSVDLTVQ